MKPVRFTTCNYKTDQMHVTIHVHQVDQSDTRRLNKQHTQVNKLNTPSLKQHTNQKHMATKN